MARYQAKTLNDLKSKLDEAALAAQVFKQSTEEQRPRASAIRHESGSYTHSNDRRANAEARRKAGRAWFSYSTGARRSWRNADTFQPCVASA
jgi:hypothetical protein